MLDKRMIQPAQSTTQTAGTAQNYGPALAVITTVFFMWGFVTVLNDILVPHLKAIFDLSYTKIMLIQSTFFSAYFLMSMPAVQELDRPGACCNGSGRTAV